MDSKKNDIGLFILRIGLAFFMLIHGIDKIKDISFIKMLLSEKSIPEILAYGVYIGEVIAPILYLIGYKIKIASYIIIINCLVAIILVFPAEIFSLSNQTGGSAIELPALYIIGGMALIFTGGGNIKLIKD